jgi:hypothetical protein
VHLRISFALACVHFSRMWLQLRGRDNCLIWPGQFKNNFLWTFFPLLTHLMSWLNRKSTVAEQYDQKENECHMTCCHQMAKMF